MIDGLRKETPWLNEMYLFERGIWKQNNNLGFQEVKVTWNVEESRNLIEENILVLVDCSSREICLEIIREFF